MSSFQARQHGGGKHGDYIWTERNHPIMPRGTAYCMSQKHGQHIEEYNTKSSENNSQSIGQNGQFSPNVRHRPSLPPPSQFDLYRSNMSSAGWVDHERGGKRGGAVDSYFTRQPNGHTLPIMDASFRGSRPEVEHMINGRERFYNRGNPRGRPWNVRPRGHDRGGVHHSRPPFPPNSGFPPAPHLHPFVRYPGLPRGIPHRGRGHSGLIRHEDHGHVIHRRPSDPEQWHVAPSDVPNIATYTSSHEVSDNNDVYYSGIQNSRQSHVIQQHISQAVVNRQMIEQNVTHSISYNVQASSGTADLQVKDGEMAQHGKTNRQSQVQIEDKEVTVIDLDGSDDDDDDEVFERKSDKTTAFGVISDEYVSRNEEKLHQQECYPESSNLEQVTWENDGIEANNEFSNREPEFNFEGYTEVMKLVCLDLETNLQSPVNENLETALPIDALDAYSDNSVAGNSSIKDGDKESSQDVIAFDKIDELLEMIASSPDEKKYSSEEDQGESRKTSSSTSADTACPHRSENEGPGDFLMQRSEVSQKSMEKFPGLDELIHLQLDVSDDDKNFLDEVAGFSTKQVSDSECVQSSSDASHTSCVQTKPGGYAVESISKFSTDEKDIFSMSESPATDLDGEVQCDVYTESSASGADKSVVIENVGHDEDIPCLDKQEYVCDIENEPHNVGMEDIPSLDKEKCDYDTENDAIVTQPPHNSCSTTEEVVKRLYSEIETEFIEELDYDECEEEVVVVDVRKQNCDNYEIGSIQANIDLKGHDKKITDLNYFTDDAFLALGKEVDVVAASPIGPVPRAGADKEVNVVAASPIGPVPRAGAVKEVNVVAASPIGPVPRPGAVKEVDVVATSPIGPVPRAGADKEIDTETVSPVGHVLRAGAVKEVDAEVASYIKSISIAGAGKEIDTKAASPIGSVHCIGMGSLKSSEEKDLKLSMLAVDNVVDNVAVTDRIVKALADLAPGESRSNACHEKSIGSDQDVSQCADSLSMKNEGLVTEEHSHLHDLVLVGKCVKSPKCSVPSLRHIDSKRSDVKLSNLESITSDRYAEQIRPCVVFVEKLKTVTCAKGISQKEQGMTTRERHNSGHSKEANKKKNHKALSKRSDSTDSASKKYPVSDSDNFERRRTRSNSDTNMSNGLLEMAKMASQKIETRQSSHKSLKQKKEKQIGRKYTETTSKKSDMVKSSDEKTSTNQVSSQHIVGSKKYKESKKSKGVNEDLDLAVPRHSPESLEKRPIKEDCVLGKCTEKVSISKKIDKEDSTNKLTRRDCSPRKSGIEENGCKMPFKDNSSLRQTNLQGNVQKCGKVEGCTQKHGQVDSNMQKDGKVEECMQKHGKVEGCTQKHGKVDSGMQKHGKVEEGVHSKVEEGMQKHGKVVGGTQKHGKSDSGIQKHGKVEEGMHKHGKVVGGSQKHGKVDDSTQKHGNVECCMQKHGKAEGGSQKNGKVEGCMQKDGKVEGGSHVELGSQKHGKVEGCMQKHGKVEEITQKHGKVEEDMQKHTKVEESMHGKIVSGMQKHGKVVESTQKHGKVEESTQKHGKVEEGMQKHTKVEESTQKHGKVEEGMQKHGKVEEGMHKYGKVEFGTQKHGKVEFGTQKHGKIEGGMQKHGTMDSATQKQAKLVGCTPSESKESSNIGILSKGDYSPLKSTQGGSNPGESRKENDDSKRSSKKDSSTSCKENNITVKDSDTEHKNMQISSSEIDNSKGIHISMAKDSKGLASLCKKSVVNHSNIERQGKVTKGHLVSKSNDLVALAAKPHIAIQDDSDKNKFKTDIEGEGEMAVDCFNMPKDGVQSKKTLCELSRKENQSCTDISKGEIQIIENAQKGIDLKIETTNQAAALDDELTIIEYSGKGDHLVSVKQPCIEDSLTLKNLSSNSNGRHKTVVDKIVGLKQGIVKCSTHDKVAALQLASKVISSKQNDLEVANNCDSLTGPNSHISKQRYAPCQNTLASHVDSPGSKPKTLMPPGSSGDDIPTIAPTSRDDFYNITTGFEVYPMLPPMDEIKSDSNSYSTEGGDYWFGEITDEMILQANMWGYNDNSESDSDDQLPLDTECDIRPPGVSEGDFNKDKLNARPNCNSKVVCDRDSSLQTETGKNDSTPGNEKIIEARVVHSSGHSTMIKVADTKRLSGVNKTCTPDQYVDVGSCEMGVGSGAGDRSEDANYTQWLEACISRHVHGAHSKHTGVHLNDTTQKHVHEPFHSKQDHVKLQEGSEIEKGSRKKKYRKRVRKGSCNSRRSSGSNRRSSCVGSSSSSEGEYSLEDSSSNNTGSINTNEAGKHKWHRRRLHGNGETENKTKSKCYSKKCNAIEMEPIMSPDFDDTDKNNKNAVIQTEKKREHCKDVHDIVQTVMNKVQNGCDTNLVTNVDTLPHFEGGAHKTPEVEDKSAEHRQEKLGASEEVKEREEVKSKMIALDCPSGQQDGDNGNINCNKIQDDGIKLTADFDRIASSGKLYSSDESDRADKENKAKVNCVQTKNLLMAPRQLKKDASHSEVLEDVETDCTGKGETQDVTKRSPDKLDLEDLDDKVNELSGDHDLNVTSKMVAKFQKIQLHLLPGSKLAAERAYKKQASCEKSKSGQKNSDDSNDDTQCIISSKCESKDLKDNAKDKHKVRSKIKTSRSRKSSSSSKTASGSSSSSSGSSSSCSTCSSSSSSSSSSSYSSSSSSSSSEAELESGIKKGSKNTNSKSHKPSNKDTSSVAEESSNESSSKTTVSKSQIKKNKSKKCKKTVSVRMETLPVIEEEEEKKKRIEEERSATVVPYPVGQWDTTTDDESKDVKLNSFDKFETADDSGISMDTSLNVSKSSEMKSSNDFNRKRTKDDNASFDIESPKRKKSQNLVDVQHGAKSVEKSEKSYQSSEKKDKLRSKMKSPDDLIWKKDSMSSNKNEKSSQKNKFTRSVSFESKVYLEKEQDYQKMNRRSASFEEKDRPRIIEDSGRKGPSRRDGDHPSEKRKRSQSQERNRFDEKSQRHKDRIEISKRSDRDRLTGDKRFDRGRVSENKRSNRYSRYKVSDHYESYKRSKDHEYKERKRSHSRERVEKDRHTRKSERFQKERESERDHHREYRDESRKSSRHESSHHSSRDAESRHKSHRRHEDHERGESDRHHRDDRSRSHNGDRSEDPDWR